MRTVNKTGTDFICDREGFIAKPYYCSAGKATIGYGSTYYADGTKVKITDKAITKAEAMQLLHKTLIKYANIVDRYTRADLTQNQFNALVSFTYNVGITAFVNSTLLKRVNANAPTWAIKEAFLMWRYAGGKQVLLKRRELEFYLYMTKDN